MLENTVYEQENQNFGLTRILDPHEIPTSIIIQIGFPVEFVLIREFPVAVSPYLACSSSSRIGSVGEEGEGTRGAVSWEEGGSVGIVC